MDMDMSQERIDALVARYNAGVANDHDLKTLETLVEKNAIDLTALHDLHFWENKVLEMETPSPSTTLDDRFYTMLAKEKKKQSSFPWQKLFSWPELAPRLGFASIALVVGMVAGYYLHKPTTSPQGEIEQLSHQVADLKEMVMLSLLEKESATERLKAVSLTEGMEQASKKVTHALLETLNHDDNVNVRLAALDVLKPYAKDSEVREALVLAIAQQDSPLVQIALAELMATLQVKSSVKELEKILKDDKTPKAVKQKIRESIDVLT